jgi:lysophospholipase L1-like esterase
MSQEIPNSTITIPPTQVTRAADGGRPSRRYRAALLRLALLVVTLVILAGLIELFVPLILGEQPKFPRRVVGAPWGLRYNEPGARYRHKSADGTWHFRINHQGMRADRDYSYQKPTGVRRIIVLGDSFTAGLEVENEQTFCSVLERELRRAGLNVEVLNAGVSGFSTAEECLYLERELMKYQPDLVIVSFCGNDLDDNVRTGLFQLEGGQLVEYHKTYVPAGRLGNFLNTNWLFNFLSERSDAFSLIKERLTILAKWNMVKQNTKTLLDAPEGGSAEAPASAENALPGSQEFQERRLLAAIYERMYQELHAKAIPLIIQSIPSFRPKPQPRLVENFPSEQVTTDRPGLYYFPAKPLLDPYLGKHLLYWQRSHFHWTPLSHELAGKALAELILRDGLLSAPSAVARAPLEDGRSQ